MAHERRLLISRIKKQLKVDFFSLKLVRQCLYHETVGLNALTNDANNGVCVCVYVQQGLVVSV